MQNIMDNNTQKSNTTSQSWADIQEEEERKQEAQKSFIAQDKKNVNNNNDFKKCTYERT